MGAKPESYQSKATEPPGKESRSSMLTIAAVIEFISAIKIVHL